MRAGVAAGRALVSSLHRISSHPQWVKSSCSGFAPRLDLKTPSSSIGVVVRREFGSSSLIWSQCGAPVGGLQVGVDGHRGAGAGGLCVGGVEGVAMGCFRPRAQNYVFLQCLATQTSAQTPIQTSAQTPTQTSILGSKASSETKASPEKSSSSPPPPSTGMGKPEEKPKPKKTGILKQMLLDFGAVPFPALVLGVAGLIPFVALAPPFAQMIPLPDFMAVGHANAQAAYGASIVSFLGAIHWGLAMADYAAPGKGGVANMTLMTSR
ncbi:hypothetical protein M758_1G178300 [Ceratodon purpureus]|nr:hypothetical protein M758_1G178300 [Ceratodon purpureus]